MTRRGPSAERQHDYFRMLCCIAARRHHTDVEFEHRFHPVRRWRFDAAFPARKVAVELDGGIFAAGRHTRGAGS